MSVRILQGDCRKLLATLPAGSVQTCVSSPPYFGQRSYLPASHPDKALEIGSEETPEQYVAALVEVFRDVRRVLRDDGTLFINAGDSYASGGRNYGAGVKAKDLLMVPSMLAFALRADGYWLRSEIVWHKPSCMPEPCRDRPTSAHEKVFLLAKNAHYFYDQDAIREPAVTTLEEYFSKVGARARGEAKGQREGVYHAGQDKAFNGGLNELGRNSRNVWTIASSPSSLAHFAMMPPELAERCIKAGTSEKGQCPSCGAPWARVVERERLVPANPSGNRETGRWAETQVARIGEAMPATTRGWAPSCACPEHKPVPQTVLDCFAGAGTTLLVADRLGRNAVGCELSAEHAATAKRRVVDDAPLLVAAE